MEFKTILYSVKDNVARVQLNRPKKLNALNPDVFREIGEVVELAQNDPEVRVIVITGNEQAFAAGADIDSMADAGIADVCVAGDKVVQSQEKLADCPKPTIAAISGFALGGGLEIALCCDFRIATETAMMGLPEISLGIIPGGGGTQRLPRLINYSVAAELIMTGDMVKADKALALGIVNQVVAVDKLEETVDAFAKKLISRPPIALRAAKIAMKKGLNVSLKDGLQIEQDLFCMLFGTEDQKEGMAAFVGKRKANFQGK